MSGLANFRAKYPEYDDVGDKELADALYQKYYSNLDLDVYYDRMGLKDETGFFDSVIEAGQRTLGSAEMMARQARSFTQCSLMATWTLMKNAEAKQTIVESVEKSTDMTVTMAR